MPFPQETCLIHPAAWLTAERKAMNSPALLTTNLYLTFLQNALIYLGLPEVMKLVSLVAG